MKDIRWLLQLKENWNSYGAKAITKEAVLAVEKLKVHPQVDGGVSVATPGEDASITFGPDGRVTGIYWEPSDR